MRQSIFSNFILLILLLQLSGVSLVIAGSLEDQPNVTESIKSKVKALKGKKVY